MKFLDWIYPPICEVCGCGLTDGQTICASCAEAMPLMTPPFCEVCGEKFHGKIDESFACVNCKGASFHFDFARAALFRCDKALELIHKLKYDKQIHLAADLGKLACAALEDPRLAIALEEKWPLVPVPLHRSRLMDRQFNQAEEIARGISLQTQLPIQLLLKRRRRTDTQTRLSRKQRMENLKNAFTMRQPFASEQLASGYLLVDDVFTTGSTVNECAKVLRKAGAQKVAVLTVMRG